MRPNESFVTQPIRSLQTMLRVIAEDDKSYPTVVPDGIYGPSTMNAVSAFQRKNDLPVTGVTDQQTWDKIVLNYEPALIRIEKAEPIEIIMDPGEVFRLGDSNPYIYLLQAILNQLSNDHPSIDPPGNSGTLDPATSRAVAQFQRLSNLDETGELDKVTWKHLSKQFSLNAHHNRTQQSENSDNLKYL